MTTPKEPDGPEGLERIDRENQMAFDAIDADAAAVAHERTLAPHVDLPDGPFWLTFLPTVADTPTSRLAYPAYWRFRDAFDESCTVAGLLAIYDDPRAHPVKRAAAVDEAGVRYCATASRLSPDQEQP